MYSARAKLSIKPNKNNKNEEILINHIPTRKYKTEMEKVMTTFLYNVNIEIMKKNENPIQKCKHRND